MSTYRPQEPYAERDHLEPVEDERDHAATQERDHLEPVEGEGDHAATQERDHPKPVEDEGGHAAAQERDHPERVEHERDSAPAQEAEDPAATATALPESERARQASTASEQLTVLEDRDAGASPTPPARPSSAHGDFQVFGPGELEGYRSRWESIQFGFLDDPRGAAEQADTVVGELLGRLTERHQVLADGLNRQSDQDVDTESMRLAVRNYRSLFQMLVGK